MASTRITKAPREQQEVTPEVQEETFTFGLPNGDVLLVGRPKTILKLKLREIFKDHKDQLEDAEIMLMAEAFLCVRTVNGVPETIRTYAQFEGFAYRFGTDALLDEFMYKYRRLKDPEAMDVIELAGKEAVEAGIVKPDEKLAYIQKKLQEFSKEQLGKVLS